VYCLVTARRAVTSKVALYLFHRHWLTRGKPIKVSNVALDGMGVARGTKWHGLLELERAGLIRIERRSRKSPLVTLIEDPEPVDRRRSKLMTAFPRLMLGEDGILHYRID
jgi:hypothetical protein